jgi:hypothetical protein
MSKKQAQNGGGQALAAPEGSAALATAAHDELAGIGMDFEDDGLSQVGPEDIRIAAKVLNMKGVDEKGRKLPEDAYYDTVDETVKEKIDAVFLHMHKSHLYSFYDQAESRMRIVCRSFDREMGTMDDGTRRPCKGCPDAEWRTEEGKRTRNCSPVSNMFAIDRDTGLPFVVRYKRTSLPIIQSYLQKHHIGRRVLAGGKRVNYPLYCFQVELSCKMSDDGKYALPVITRGPVLSEQEILAHAENARTLRESVLPILNKVEDTAEAKEAPPDTSFDYGANVKQDFVDAPAADASTNAA